MHVGTNNFGNTPEEISEGIVEIVHSIRARLPETYIVVVVSMFVIFNVLMYICVLEYRHLYVHEHKKRVAFSNQGFNPLKTFNSIQVNNRRENVVV